MAPPATQIEVERLRPWAAVIAAMAREPDVRFPTAGAEHPFVLAGMLLRESGAGYGGGYLPAGSLIGWGDNHCAFSQWQFDKRDRDNLAWISTPEAQTREGQVRRVVYYLREGRMMLSWALGGELLERAAVAAYNADARKVLRGALRGNPDEPTTPSYRSPVGDYSRWVFDKAASLFQLAPDLFG